MSRVPVFGAVAVATLAICASQFAFRPTSADERRKVVVSVADVDQTVTLMGRLGQPLGTMMEVRGTWKYPPVKKSPEGKLLATKDTSLRFVVSHVNGKPLNPPLDIHRLEARTREGVDAVALEQKKGALVGDTWTMRGYETGNYSGVPEEYWKESGIGSVALPVWTQPFDTEFVGIVTQAEQGSGTSSPR